MNNVFQVSDKNHDQINVGIYTDVYEHMFKCGTYNISNGEAIDFRGLKIPCQDRVCFVIQEEDVL